MTVRTVCGIGVAVLLAAAALAQLPAGLTVSSGPAGSAQVGVYYSSAITACCGVAPYTFTIASGSLPPGLNLGLTTGAITGTPTAAGTYTFTAFVSDSTVSIQSDNPVHATPDAARLRTQAQSGMNAATITSPSFTITVSGGAAGAPTSVWTLGVMMAGLAGAGFLRLRHARRA